MRANELRIGNLVIDMDGSIYKIASGMDIDGVWNPIELTEEWLERLGFENGFKQYEWLNWGMYVEKGLGEDWIVSVGFMNVKHEIKVINHVHKLQNIYYEHSDEELTIINKNSL